MSICIGERVQRLSVLFNKITHVEISKRWLIVLFAGSIMLGNHYARDAVGALEIQMESDLSITATQYATINSVYFIPSVIAPLLAGIATEYLGGAAKCLFYSVFFGSLGHIIFSLGIQFDSMELIFLGRSVAGKCCALILYPFTRFVVLQISELYLT
jgi:MFS family permease